MKLYPSILQFLVIIFFGNADTELNQHSHITFYNRYPDIFQYALDSSSIYQANVHKKKVLSFGCSYGAEVRTLSDLYFKNDQVDGVEYSNEIVNKLQKENTTEKNHFYNKMSELAPLSYDVVFAMSVLLQWPERAFSHPYPFHKFNHSLQVINHYVKVNGFIVLYNAKYRFTDLNLFKNGCYVILENNNNISMKFPNLTVHDPLGKPVVVDSNIFGFRKIKVC